MTLETRLETTVQDGFTWLEERTLSVIRFILFIISLPQRVLPTLLHVAAFTTILPPLLAVSLIAGFTVVNMIPQGWDVNLWMQYGEQATPYARTALPPLVPGQSYDIYLSLDVPITPDNLALGNFMTKLILTDARNTTVATANRPALVFKDKSGWVPFITSSSNIETISIPLVESWSPVLGAGILSNTGLAVARGSTQKGYHAFIAVGRPDSWTSLGNGQGRELSIARAVLHGRANISGIRGFFARHKLLLFTLTSTAFFAASAGAALALYVMFAPDLSGGTGSEKSPETLLQGRDTRTIRRTRVGDIKEEETEPPSASESDYTYMSGGIGSIGAESGDERLIFPGVGAFHSAITHLTESGLLEPLKAYIASGKPYFGICIGMQVLFESSTENPSTKGLGIIPAQIEEFGRADKAVPHMGWNIAELVDEDPQDEAQTGISRDASFYFVHSFRAAYDATSAASDWAHATTQYGQELFLSTVRKGNVFATQFHPEKSGEAGLNVLKSWLSAPTEAVDGRGKSPYKRTARTPRPKDRFIKRVIACMDVRANDEGDLVVTKGDQYDVREKETSPKAQVVVQSSSRPSSPSRAVRNLGKPVSLAKAYYDAGADEICLLNITSFRNSPLVDQPMLAVVRAAAAETFVPLTIGGGIKDTVDPDGTPRTALEVAGAYFRAGADKVSIGSEAVVAVEAMLARPGQTLGGTSPMETISHVYGRQAVVVSIDPRKVYVTDPTDHADELVIGKEAISAKEDEKDKMWWYQATTQGGRTNRPLSIVQLAKGAERLGAGEILLNSIDRDGTNIGYDLDLINLVKKAVNIPVVASSGAGKPADFIEVFEKTGVEAALAAGIFHRREVRIPDVKIALEGAQINARK